MQISTLLIVESPTIAKTIDGFNLPGLEVVPTAGYSWKPRADFVKGTLKGHAGPEMLPVRKRIRTAATHASRVYLATDTDPSGEFIAMCLARELKNKRLFRCYLNLMSPRGVTESMGMALPYQAGATQALLNRLYLNEKLTAGLPRFFYPATESTSARKSTIPLSVLLGKLALCTYFFTERSYHEFNCDGRRFTSIKPVLASSAREIVINKTEFTRKIYDLNRPWNSAEFICRYKPGETDKNTVAGKESHAGRKNGYHSFTGSHFNIVQGILNRLFTTVPDDIGTGLISYPRTHSSGFYRATWQNEYECFIRRYPAEEFLPVPLWSITPDVAPHEGIRPLDMNLLPADIRPLLGKDLYDAYTFIHNASATVFRKPASAERFLYKDEFENVYVNIPSQFAGNVEYLHDHSLLLQHNTLKLTPNMSSIDLIDYLTRYALMPASAAGKTLDILIRDGWITLSDDQVSPGDQLRNSVFLISKAGEIGHILETVAGLVSTSEHPSQLDDLIHRMITIINEPTHG
ncbi:MAG: toprim domain-containing protein [Cyclonatronaceae bacterium]